MEYGLEHLRTELKLRDPATLHCIASVNEPEPHPLFEVVVGEVGAWEMLR